MMRLATPQNETVSGTGGLTSLGISRSNLEVVALISILVLGASLRFWHITVGLPVFYEHDEIFEVHRALELLRGEYDFSRTKGMYFYFLSLMSLAYGSLLILLGYFSDLKSFVSYSLVHPGDIILLSRLLCAALGTFSIFLIYRLGQHVFPMYSPGPLLVALAWATCWLATWISKWGLIESTVMVFGMLAFFPILHLLENRNHISYILAGLLIACATATKIYGALLIVPLVFAHVMSHERNFQQRGRSTIVHGKLVLAFVVFGVSLSVLNPALLVQWWETGDGSTIIPKLSVEAKEVYPLFFYLGVLRWNIGNMLMIFLLAGLVTGIMKFDKKICTCSIFAVSFFLALGLKKEGVFIFDRYLLISLPYFFLVAVYGVEVVRARAQDMVSQLGLKRMVQGFLIVLVALGVSWNGIGPIMANPIMNPSFVPVHQEALAWFEANVPEGSTVVIRGESRPWPVNQNLPLYDLKQNYLSLYEKLKEEGKSPAEINYLRDLAADEDVVRFNLVNETRYVLWKIPVEYIEKQGVEYFVVDVEHFDSQFSSRRSVTATESRRTFYQHLVNSSDVTLIQTFRGHTIIGGPRTIEIYKVRDSKVLLASKRQD